MCLRASSVCCNVDFHDIRCRENQQMLLVVVLEWLWLIVMVVVAVVAVVLVAIVAVVLVVVAISQFDCRFSL